MGTKLSCGHELKDGDIRGSWPMFTTGCSICDKPVMLISRLHDDEELKMQSAGQTSYASLINGIRYMAHGTKDKTVPREKVIQSFLNFFSTREVVEAILKDMTLAGYITDDGQNISVVRKETRI